MTDVSTHYQEGFERAKWQDQLASGTPIVLWPLLPLSEQMLKEGTTGPQARLMFIQIPDVAKRLTEQDVLGRHTIDRHFSEGLRSMAKAHKNGADVLGKWVDAGVHPFILAMALNDFNLFLLAQRMGCTLSDRLTVATSQRTINYLIDNFKIGHQLRGLSDRTRASQESTEYTSERPLSIPLAKVVFALEKKLPLREEFTQCLTSIREHYLLCQQLALNPLTHARTSDYPSGLPVSSLSSKGIQASILPGESLGADSGASSTSCTVATSGFPKNLSIPVSVRTPVEVELPQQGVLFDPTTGAVAASGEDSSNTMSLNKSVVEKPFELLKPEPVVVRVRRSL